jgi:ATP-dependent helicase HrpA
VASNPRAVAARSAERLSFEFNPALPITARREDILAALETSQVLVVAGDTGSGKSTQLPQYCLERGRGTLGQIAHTQPRRLAARALALRIAEELKQPLGRSVGFRVRFADRVSEATRLVLMTDGLLLAELTSDPLLRRYDTIIVDEAHERSLNVDLLLGVLKRILPQRPDLKVIITSATLDVERIARFFGDAPTLAIGGRGYPIEVRYRETPESDDPDLPAAVLAACQEAATEPGALGGGDMLVFLPGEREIRDVGELLRREVGSADVLELYSRLSWEQQSRIFQPGTRPRVVLATNVAETSITVPGIRTVIDSGFARISRYSPRNRLQRLPIERISRASADQRKGRCGRLGPGLCIRLYAEADFESRAEFTEPEILRTNLAALLLRLAADGLGAAEDFPFIDAPDARALNDGYRLLQELEALDADRRITRLGRSMARLPLDPRLARALIESKRFHAESELLAIVAGLSVPDFRSVGPEPAPGRPVPAHPGRSPGASEPATAEPESLAVGAFDDPRSEFSALVKVWRAYRKAREGTRRELRRWCKERRFSLLRLSEWEDVHAQVKDRAAEMGIRASDRAASYTAVHRALLAGFCTMIGSRGEEGSYAGPRGISFHIFPGSPLARRRPRWIMAAHIVETSRVFARRVAQIEPHWIEGAAAHLLKREYLEPDWSEEREEVAARERVSLLGLILSANRIVNYGPIAPEESRGIFAREALAHRRLHRRPDWLRENDAALDAAQRMEERLRSRDLLQGAETLADFYDRRLPRQISSAATLEHFSRHLTDEDRRALRLTDEQIFARFPDAAELARFPERVEINGFEVGVEYRFAPGEPGDGATLRVPLLAVPEMTRAAVDGAVPGLAAPRIEALLRSLPKNARRQLIPIADSTVEFMADAARDAAALDLTSLRRWLKERRGLADGELHFDPTVVPRHLVPHVQVVEAGMADDDLPLPALRRAGALAARAELDRRTARAPGGAEAWRRFELPALHDAAVLGVEGGTQSRAAADDAAAGVGAAVGAAAPGVRIFPTLARQGAALKLRYEWSAAEARRSWRMAAPRLARGMLAAQVRDLRRTVLANAPLLLAAGPYVKGDALADLLLTLAVRSACFGDEDAARTRAEFEGAVDAGRGRLYACFDQACSTALGWFEEARAVRRLVEGSREGRQGRSAALVRAGAGRSRLPDAAGDTSEQPGASSLAAEASEHLARLLAAESLESMPPAWLRQLPRYLKAEARRWQRIGERGSEPPEILAELQGWWARYQALERSVGAELRFLPDLEQLHFWIEEYRVSLYAQELRTLGPVSAARLSERAAVVEAWINR